MKPILIIGCLICAIGIFHWQCDINQKEIINLESCPEIQDSIIINPDGSYRIPTKDTILFKKPCYKENTDTLLFQFGVNNKMTVRLEILEEDNQIKQTLIDNDTLMPGDYIYYWKNTNYKDVIGVRYSNNKYSKTFWFIR